MINEISILKPEEDVRMEEDELERGEPEAEDESEAIFSPLSQDLFNHIPSQFHRELQDSSCNELVADDLPPMIIKIKDTNQSFIATEYNQIKIRDGQVAYRFPGGNNYYSEDGTRIDELSESNDYCLDLENAAVVPFKHYSHMYYGSEALVNVYSFIPAPNKLGLAVAIFKNCTTSKEDGISFEFEW